MMPRIFINNDVSLSPTGRLVKKNHPNIQNIPIRTETGRIIREAYLKHLYGEKK